MQYDWVACLFHQAAPYYLFYRVDVLSNTSTAVPETWTDLLEAAAKLNGTDTDGDGEPDYAICLNIDPGCKLSYFFLSILAPILQTRGFTQGIFFDRDTMEPLVNNAGMEHALALYANLTKFIDPQSSKQCEPHDSRFNAGEEIILGYNI
jgi:ABC-type glycerol-3-phosphate transport system substrate-binding protein